MIISRKLEISNRAVSCSIVHAIVNKMKIQCPIWQCVFRFASNSARYQSIPKPAHFEDPLSSTSKPRSFIFYTIQRNMKQLSNPIGPTQVITLLVWQLIQIIDKCYRAPFYEYVPSISEAFHISALPHLWLKSRSIFISIRWATHTKPSPTCVCSHSFINAIHSYNPLTTVSINSIGLFYQFANALLLLI